MEHGASVPEDFFGFEALFENFTYKNSLQILSLVLSEARHDVFRRSMVLEFAASGMVVEMLLEIGADVDCLDAFGRNRSFWTRDMGTLPRFALYIPTPTLTKLRESVRYSSSGGTITRFSVLRIACARASGIACGAWKNYRRSTTLEDRSVHDAGALNLGRVILLLWKGTQWLLDPLRPALVHEIEKWVQEWLLCNNEARLLAYEKYPKPDILSVLSEVESLSTRGKDLIRAVLIHQKEARSKKRHRGC
ncbi:hypothetical protein EV126DRAFT_45543 [Verticillium dahliae]|nr:hypothetical protein EV126DRAFT_45543 [Verticillium dahliae]